VAGDCLPADLSAIALAKVEALAKAEALAKVGPRPPHDSAQGRRAALHQQRPRGSPL